MLVQEAQEHAAAAAHGAAEKFNAGEVIIHHVANSSHEDPLIHLPTLWGIDFSVTKHVFMLWLVAAIVFTVITWSVRRYLKQDRLIPTGLMNGIEAIVEFIRDEIVQPNVGAKWVKTWAPLILTIFFFILVANAIGLIPIFDALGLAWPIYILLIPIEIMGMFVRPFALTMRLAANMTGGHIAILAILSFAFLFAELFGSGAGTGVGLAGSVLLAVPMSGLEIIVVLVQAYVFTLLTAVFIGM